MKFLAYLNLFSGAANLLLLIYSIILILGGDTSTLRLVAVVANGVAFIVATSVGLGVLRHVRAR